MNNFYKQPKLWQWIEALLLLMLGLYPALVIIEIAFDQPFFYLLFLIYLPIGQFTITPILTLSGIYKYYSPMLLGYMPNDIQIDLHSGGSFDYLFVMRNYKIGVETRNRILIYHLEGFMNIIKQIENGSIPKSVNIYGTSYFFNKRTLTKLGFELKKPTLFYRINLFVNFIDLIWMYSISQGHFSIPKIWTANKASIEGLKLAENKDMIFELHRKLTIKTKTNS
ncbi:MAG: hypothetical protein ABIP79_12070 [Chitinophagaceae bacterium]